MLSEIVGNTALRRELDRSLSTGRFFHAYLFAGPAGSGKKTVARQFAQGILCEGGDKPCQACTSCHLYLQHNHPDYIELLPENGRVSVRMIRELLAELANRPYQAGYRVILMPEADRYNASCQNALLKTLEEPPANTVFLLLAEKAELLLPTIRSRTRLMRMGLLSTEEIASELQKRGIERERALYSAEVSNGNLGDALTFSGDDEYWEMLDTTLSVFEKTRSEADCVQVLQTIRNYTDKQQDVFLNQTETVCRQLLYRDAGLKEAFPSMERLDAVADRFTTGKIHAIIDAVISARKRLEANVSWPNASETVLFAFL